MYQLLAGAAKDSTSGGARSQNLGGAFEGQHAFWGGGGKIEFYEISPPPRCQNF